MHGLMQEIPLMISSLIRYAAEYHGDRQVVSPERREQIAPCVPELGKAMDEEDQRSVTGMRAVEPDGAGVDGSMLDRDRHGGPPLPLSVAPTTADHYKRTAMRQSRSGRS